MKCNINPKRIGSRIYKNHKTVPDTYSRSTMSIEFLITIFKALQKDFIAILYTEEPLRGMRNDEIALLNLEIKKAMEAINRIQKELTLTQTLVDFQKPHY
ncbi:hypothetical protein [Niastella populi]|uniref:Uncharacterized protein n=1 Tax=Niastella populi TaxID=550983 RepID=A0A1V9FXF3_9BACT|nr:hypothetical protein [Niastella populi]OQP63049.1 hypothetical protein A4R26_17900 [Niastella populi]